MAATKTNYPPNSAERKDRTAKRNECQLCHSKAPLKDQFTVVNDLEAGKARKRKVGSRDIGGLSHYCSDCAAKRVTQKETWMEARGSSNGSGKSKSGGSSKAAAKPSATAKAKAAKVKAARKRVAAAKPKATKAADPF